MYSSSDKRASREKKREEKQKSSRRTDTDTDKNQLEIRAGNNKHTDDTFFRSNDASSGGAGAACSVYCVGARIVVPFGVRWAPRRIEGLRRTGSSVGRHGEARDKAREEHNSGGDGAIVHRTRSFFFYSLYVTYALLISLSLPAFVSTFSSSPHLLHFISASPSSDVCASKRRINQSIGLPLLLSIALA